MKVLTVIGTRPEAIKMAPVVAELQRFAEIESRVLITSQHRELLAQVLDVFNIAPHYDLDVMRPDQAPTDVLAAVLTRIQPILEDFCNSQEHFEH
jgi:UDP-N-acetylglucosamine 2-epimerase (non-hydrolysing)